MRWVEKVVVGDGEGRELAAGRIDGAGVLQRGAARSRGTELVAAAAQRDTAQWTPGGCVRARALAALAMHFRPGKQPAARAPRMHSPCSLAVPCSRHVRQQQPPPRWACTRGPGPAGCAAPTARPAPGPSGYCTPPASGPAAGRVSDACVNVLGCCLMVIVWWWVGGWVNGGNGQRQGLVRRSEKGSARRARAAAAATAVAALMQAEPACPKERAPPARGSAPRMTWLSRAGCHRRWRLSCAAPGTPAAGAAGCCSPCTGGQVGRVGKSGGGGDGSCW